MTNNVDLLNLFLLIFVFAIILLSIFYRIYICLPINRKNFDSNVLNVSLGVNKKVSTMIVFGSGGHTSEMLLLIEKLSLDKYGPLHFLLSHVFNITIYYNSIYVHY